MLAKFRNAGLIWPSVLTLIGMFVLVSLGTWQLKRKAWKEALIADIEMRSKMPPISLRDAQNLLAQSGIEDLAYRRVTANGSFVHDKERHLFAHKKYIGVGYDVYTPLLVAPNEVVWVNRGFVSEAVRSPDLRKEGQIAGDVDIEGRIRLPQKPGLFTPANQPKENMWYWRDLSGMQASAFGDGNVKALPFFIEAGDVAQFAPVGNGQAGGTERAWPKPGASTVVIVNRHFEYALTWYGLALTLIAVYVAFAFGRLRKQSD